MCSLNLNSLPTQRRRGLHFLSREALIPELDASQRITPRNCDQTRRFLFTQGHPFWGKEFHGQSTAWLMSCTREEFRTSITRGARIGRFLDYCDVYTVLTSARGWRIDFDV